MSRQIIVSLNSVQGHANIAVVANGVKQTFEFEWRMLPNGDEGFATNFHKGVVRLTVVSAQLFLESFLEILRQATESKDITILNDRGDCLSEIEFLPPTFEYGADELTVLVERQETLKRVNEIYENNGRRTTVDFLDACRNEGILDDFLSILESKLIGIRFNLDCLQEGMTEE